VNQRTALFIALAAIVVVAIWFMWGVLSTPSAPHSAAPSANTAPPATGAPANGTTQQ
jgi:hypothetical protein